MKTVESLFEIFSHLEENKIRRIYELNKQNYEETLEELLSLGEEQQEDEKIEKKDEQNLEFLSSIINLNQQIISIIYLESERDVSKTLDILLNLRFIEDEKKSKKKSKLEEKVDTLHEIFPDISKNHIKAELIVGNLDVKEVFKKLEIQIYLEKEKKKSTPKPIYVNPDESFASIVKKEQKKPENYIQLSHNYTPTTFNQEVAPQQFEEEEDMFNIPNEELRKNASNLALERNRYFNLAIQAFQRGDGKKAKEFSEKGKKANVEMHQLNFEASSKLLEKNENESNNNTLDLHGFFVKEALEILEDYLFHFKKKSKILYSKKVFVITGTGQHSKNGKAKLRPAVQEYLKKSNFKFKEIHPGVFQILK
jgi:DNA-nicking Smr family endonuclease